VVVDELTRISAFQPNLNPEVSKITLGRVTDDFNRFAEHGLPNPLEPYILDTYHLDVSSTYAGIHIKNPWGKASGQLSMTAQQVQEDADAGLGFMVLKTVIAEDALGDQSMKAWAIPETRMMLERITGAEGAQGWTVSWKGRGWFRSFDDYLNLVRDARSIGDAAGMLTVPSCKYFLPTPDRPQWQTEEYQFTTQRLLSAYTDRVHSATVPVPIEKDFSPTLAGSSLAADKRQILDWLTHVPKLIRQGAASSQLRVALKLFNALFDDDFQLEMLQTVASAGENRPDAVVYANRLFDPNREFDGHRGIAFGGPDLSTRNLRILTRFQDWRRTQQAASPLELSATGNIASGRHAVEYMLRGCSSFQLHTFFQLPASEYPMRRDSKIARALHRLYFDPREGFIVWALHAARHLGIGTRPGEPLTIGRIAHPE
jgi:dihydroorotate dehydrogenase